MLLALLAIDQANREFTDAFNNQVWDQLQAGYSNTSRVLWNNQFGQSPYQWVYYKALYLDGVRALNRTANHVEVTKNVIHEIGTLRLDTNQTDYYRYYTAWNPHTLLREMEVLPWKPQETSSSGVNQPLRLRQFTYLYNQRQFDLLVQTLFTRDAFIVTPTKFLHQPDFVRFMEQWDNNINMTSVRMVGTYPLHELGQRSRDRMYYALWEYDTEWRIRLFIPY